MNSASRLIANGLPVANGLQVAKHPVGTPPASHFTFYILRFFLFALLPGLSLLLNLAASRLGGFTGFPLDDAWIHQTYARNLAALHQFAFVSGQPSAGSTSPLWTVLLALGYWLHIEYHVWTYTLGAALLGLNAWLAYRLVLALWPERSRAALLAGVFVALEWHMAWAAASGMETLLFSALGLAVFVMAPGRAAWLGLCVGVSVLARPDGLTLLPFALARIFFAQPRGLRYSRSALPTTLKCLLGFGVVFLPYLAFNQWLAGSIWPNTFYAKAAEYAVQREWPLWERAILRCVPTGCEPGLGLLPFVGAQVMLAPGLALAMWQPARARQWGALLPAGGGAAFLAAYVIRLPVTYQHGRYLMPVIPILVALGVGGSSAWLRLQARQLWLRVASRAWLAATGLLVVVFWLNGAAAYARDVQIIETEMVATAHWVGQHTPAGALIAAHDIGALGYFGGRRLLDMAGLVSPEVIPFIRDEDRLREWLTAAGAEYLVTFPGWYPALARPLGPAVFSTRAPYSLRAGGENMAVYRWPPAHP